jgi:hypothetical protein
MFINQTTTTLDEDELKGYTRLITKYRHMRRANYHSLEEIDGLMFYYIVLSHVLEHLKSKPIEETNIFKWFLCIINGEWFGVEFGIIVTKYSKRVG